MDIDPQNFFQTLKNQSTDSFKGPTECLRLLAILNYNFTEEQLDASLVDLYIYHIFNKTNGIFSFILEVVNNSKFDYATGKSFELIYTILNNFSNKIGDSVLDINDKCLKVLQSSASAKVKTKALDVLLISFEKIDKCLENQEKYAAVFDGVRACLIQAIHTDSIRQKEFMAIGLFVKKFRYLITGPDSLKNYFIMQLDRQIVKGPSQSVLYGIFTGLNYFCESFPLSLENPDDAVIIEKLYKYIRDLSKAEGKVKYANRAALCFFASYMNLFMKTVINEYKQWHKRLLVEWLNMGIEEKKAGEQALKALLMNISHSLAGMDKKNCMPILTHFIGWFKSIIRKEKASATEKKLCVQGLKYFCSPLYKHYPKEEARDIFLMIMQNFEKLYVLNENPDYEDKEFLPDYVQCLASFMRYQTFSNGEIYCLQRAVISMIKSFDKLKPLHHSIVIDALVTTLFYLKETKHFEAFLENIVYQGVVWSCSHQHISDSNLKDVVTVKNYFPLWRGLLKLATNRQYDKVSIYFDDRQYILTKIVNELIKIVLILINKLNINVKLKEDVIQTDIETAYQVEHSSDFAIFLNVIDFYEEIFMNIEPAMLRLCICKLINHLVEKCIKFPLISGFYRLLSFVLKIANELMLFDAGNITLNQNVANCKETLPKFLTFLLHKMKQFKDELLISCLHVLLECPIVIIEPLLPECTGIFVTVFDVGRSYIALANMGLNTLEHWQKSINQTDFEPFIIQVIPCLDSYLRSKFLGGLSQTNALDKRRKGAQGLKKRTVLVQLEPELVKFQKRVLRFVGSQNSHVCRAFVMPDNNFERKVTSDNLHLKVALPYEDLALEIHLEPFIMRVVELSLYSSDRKTRIMACELLQAFVMVFLGRTKQMAHSGLSDLEDLFKNLAMPLLQLGCDIDQVVRQIFEPLFMQLVHWYTSKVQRESPHLAVIIDVLMEGVTHPTNSSLRDFSGKSLNEFVKWTVKQSSEQELKTNPQNIKILVKRIRFFSSHPDLVKKLGAALIFNNIYKEIREERALISIFSMELLHIFINSLALLEYSNEEVDNTVTQILNAIGHLKRIFMEKAPIFRTTDNLRRIPSDITEGTLEGLVKWILSMTASRSKYCRDISMELFIHIQPLCGTKESLPACVLKQYPDDNFQAIFAEHINKNPTLHDLKITEDCTLLLKWLQALLCLIDGYLFIIKNSLGQFDYDNKSIEFFLKFVQTSTIEQASKLISKNSSAIITAVDKEHFSNLKLACNLAIMKLASALLHSNNENQFSFWNKYLHSLILNAIFNPGLLAFDERVSQPEYLEVLRILLNNIPRKLKGEQTNVLVTVFRKFVADNLSIESIDLKRNVGLKQRNTIKGLLLIQNSQLDTSFKTEEISFGLIQKLMQKFLQNIDENVIYINRLSDITTEYCNSIFKLTLKNPKEFEAFLSYLFNSTLVSCQEDSQNTFGLYLLTTFEPVTKHIIGDFDRFLKASDNIELIIKLTNYLLKYLENNKKEFKNNLHAIAENILDKWYLFQLYFEENSIDLGLNFVRQIWKIFGSSLSYIAGIQNWVLSLLSSNEVLLTELEGVNLYLNIFGVVAEVVDDDTNVDNLRVALENLSSKLDPVIANAQNTTLTEKLLTILPTVKSQHIFKYLIEFYTRNSAVSKNEIDMTNLLKVFIMKTTEENQAKILQAIFELVLDKNKNFQQKMKLLDNILPYIFKYCSYKAFESFFETNIQQIVELQGATEPSDAIIGFQLVELLFLRIPIGSQERTYCSITEASGSPKLRAHLLKLALDAFRNNEIKENLRIYKCSAYKALASIISNSIRTENFYEKLFVRLENNEDILWNSLIDTNVSYNFPIDFDSYPRKRKILVSIRDELRQQNEQNQQNSFRYIESQRLFKSSLNEDVTKFDFTNSILRTSTTKNEENDLTEDNPNLETKFFEGEIYLESTEINNHELMGTVCGIIEHIFASGICQLPENEDEMVEFPKWMEGIRNLLLNPNTHKNIKFFWIKVIDNMIHIFRHFAKYFTEPLLQFLNDKTAGNDLNYFISDVIVVLTSWTSLIQLNEKEAQLASAVLKHIVTILTNDRQDAFKYNLDLVKLFVENWKEFIEVPYDNLFAKLNFDVNDRKIEAGVHLTSIFLVNEILPCENANITTFWKKILSILTSSVSTIYKPCAETVGLMLKYFKNHQLKQQSFDSEVSKLILRFDSTQIDKYASCLEGVGIHYPKIINSYHVIKMLNRLSQSNPNLQCSFLKIIFKGVDILGEVDSFKGEDWDKYLESQSAEVQLITLEIILKTFQILKQIASFKNILKSVCKNLTNPNTFCRGRMYDILMAILEVGNIDDKEITDLCKEVLIQGLVDTDIETRDKIRKFWSENPLVPSTISNKFRYLLSNFYLAKVEEHFLGYTSYFLLDSIIFDEYEKELFEHPLEDCDFEEYKLQTNWRLQHPSVVPMFAETLRTYTEGLDDGSSVELGAIRATQDNLTFAPTQQSVRERHISQIVSLESTLIGNNNNTFINPNAVQISQNYKLPKRRFLKDKAKISAGFAHSAVAEKIQKVSKRYDAAKEQEKKVTIYRSYRKGDFPDIQISLGSLVKPLQMLALHDGELSKILFSCIHKSLKEKLKNTQDGFGNFILESIKHIFTASMQFNANVISTLLDILLQSKKEFQINPELLAKVCQQSGLVSVGALLLEEYLISINAPSDYEMYYDNVETPYWLKLAELYKDLNEWDLVRKIFLEKTNCKEDVHKAIILESDKRWRDAQEKYENLIRTDPSPACQDFYYESYFKCLAHLGEWDKLPIAVESLVPEGGEKTWDSLWDNDWFQQKILPWFVSAKVKNTLFTGNDCSQFLTDINKSLSNPEQADYLKNKFSEELCILWLTQKDNAQAAQYLKNSLDNFLSDWQLLNPMFGNLRYNKILNLRTLIEIDQFLTIEKTLAESSGAENLKRVQDYWKSTQKELLPSIVLSESKLLYRKLFNKLLMNKVSKFNQTELVKELKKNNIILDMAFMNLAVEEENYYMTRKYYKDYVQMNHPNLTMIFGSLACLYANLVKNDYGLKLQKLLEGLKKFREIILSNKEDKVIVALLKIFDISEKVVEVLTNNPDLYGKYEKDLTELFGGTEESPLEIARCNLKKEILKNCSENQPDIIEAKTKALVKLAYFIQHDEDQEADFLLYVLRAMTLGSKEARQLFPCILLKKSLQDELKDIFLNETADIPTWMFLGWIPQLLANADCPKVEALSEIILRIARTYPQAIMYSYRLSKETYSNVDENLIEELDRLLLSDPVVDKFLTALSKVSVPLVTLEYYIKKLFNCQDIDSMMQKKNDLFEFFFTEDSDSRDSSNMQGNMYKSIVKDFKNEFQKITNRLTLPKIKDLVANITKKRHQILNPPPGQRRPQQSKLLKDYCPWLANFSAGRLNLDLEIPGQYTGEKLPLVQHHIRISGFCDSVNVMSSLRRPIKVTMVGMDSKEYPFLIKFGEDIRQDQRIEQLFMLMNNALASDNKTHHVLTYQVIPLTSSLGIIQWVENTVSLEDFIKRALPEKKRQSTFDSLYSKYEKFLERHDNNTDKYGMTALKKDRNKIIPFYRGLVNELPLNALRASIWSVSLTTESFIAFRDNFIKSYATICACQWILGIGDRHLQNTKVCTRNGKVLGIDFGHAFGTATQILPIPELVPIRLTPHIVDLMEPLAEKGSFKHVMIDCLNSLRNNKAPLLATMNVFIQEPSVDWLENAKKFQMADAVDTHEWYPLRKIEQAKRKLEGASSTTILVEDLKSSSFYVSKPKYFETYVKFVQGDAPYDLRARLSSKETLSVEEQVDCLIDHAMDPNLLGRMFSGWNAAV
ncbi:unnamed protein product [Ceutorhynchus assimilis]|uniref:non-specific serine/threonine protein kinase n=1 Tax=Ceutorhynchus assimilis TaxID=467358 RepID=A0A9N9QPZ6_9CUCU|nr:unnamed protein product [Ceutorhynchus assimilis]